MNAIAVNLRSLTIMLVLTVTCPIALSQSHEGKNPLKGETIYLIYSFGLGSSTNTYATHQLIVTKSGQAVIRDLKHRSYKRVFVPASKWEEFIVHFQRLYLPISEAPPFLETGPQRLSFHLRCDKISYYIDDIADKPYGRSLHEAALLLFDVQMLQKK